MPEGIERNSIPLVAYTIPQMAQSQEFSER